MTAFTFGLFLIFGLSTVQAAPCTYKSLKPVRWIGTTGVYAVGPKTELHVEDGQKGRDYFWGPVSVFSEGKKRCEFRGGIFSAFYLSSSGARVLTAEYSGSSGSNRVVDLSNCQVDVTSAEYGGNARLENGTSLVNKPACEPLDEHGKKASCFTAHVYLVTGECKLKLDEAASRELTKKIVGIELPMTGDSTVQDVGTPKAKIVP